jgi:hypothetical protein
MPDGALGCGMITRPVRVTGFLKEIECRSDFMLPGSQS